MSIDEIIEERKKLQEALGPLPPHYTEPPRPFGLTLTGQFAEFVKIHKELQNQRLRGRFVHRHKNRPLRQHRLTSRWA